ncbi:hypothetical protein Enr13x_76350 [Stieleria neptunia]|uniref:Uncharacterized protein n=1 Tax=Stieleria neptunia TaxID=2527979 RepID=A0A518I3S2_9BACT|nr:hypothetical protein [Stieleria neptunia]QDV47724.1 hypothetical protein Enr13x_76350 [Stieleria neptunia]
MTDHAKEYSLLPFAICQAWQLEVGYERSFKVVQGRVLANRYLIGIPTATLTHERAREIARRLGMPELDDQIFWSLYPDANLLLIGFEDSEPGCVFKLYLEFDDQPIVVAEHSAGPSLRLHRGVKWNVGGVPKPRASDYVWMKGCRLSEIGQHIDSVIGGMSIESELRELIQHATRDVAGDSLRYLEVVEGGRRSFDLNLYATGLQVGAVMGLCRAACVRLGVPAEPIDRLAAIVAKRPLGHLAAGRDSAGNEFFTIYYEPSP